MKLHIEIEVRESAQRMGVLVRSTDRANRNETTVLVLDSTELKAGIEAINAALKAQIL